MKKEKNKKIITALLSVLAVVAAMLALSAIYLSDYYHASKAAMNALNLPPANTEVRIGSDRIDIIPDEPTAGIIFYPGGKVEFEAYVPLLEAFAQRGVLCVMPEMPGNLAVLNIDAADGIQSEYSQIKNWYLAGHSLGGAMAANYAGSHADDYSGVILLAAYSTKDLSHTNLRTITIYGSQDGVLNMDKLEQNRVNLPADAQEIIIEGGCHAYFGSYGNQDGDRNPSISRESQIEQTADAVVNFIKNA